VKRSAANLKIAAGAAAAHSLDHALHSSFGRRCGARFCAANSRQVI
jgi:hypothetical protein